MTVGETSTAVARLLEMIVRTAFTREGLAERHLTDWPALRYFSSASAAARTRQGLQTFLGLDLLSTSAVIGRLLDANLLASGSDDVSYILTPAGGVMLGLDPSERLTAVIATLTPVSRHELAQLLEVLAENLVQPGRGRPH